MSAEVLRSAAELMRERAQSVDYPSPWEIGGGTCEIRCNEGRNYVASTYGGVGREERAAEHIASWHPAVTLLVADWLDAEAKWADIGATNSPAPEAIAVATAYLGSDA